MSTEICIPCTDDKKFECDVGDCEYRSKQKGALNRHKSSIHNIGNIWSECDVDDCGYKCKIKSSLNRHHSFVHRINVFWIKCDIDGCNYKCIEKYGLKTHKANVHDIGAKWTFCDIGECAYKTKQYGSLTTHKKFVHDIGVKWMFCNIGDCTSKFKQKGGLTQHKKFVHDIGAKFMFCNIGGCTSKFKQKSEMKQHNSNIHDINIEWKYCNVGDCKSKFKQKSSLKKHQTDIHDINVIWRVCDVGDCKSKFKQNSGLNKHKSYVHDIGDHECNFCLKNVSKLTKYNDKEGEHEICRACYKKATGYKGRIEKQTVEYLKEHIDFPMLCADSTIQGEACLKYRPDVLYADHDRVIIVEIDEHQHGRTGYSCDEKRMSDIYDEFPGKTLIWIRWNPDNYKPPIGETKKNREQRLSLLVDTINDCRTRKIDTMMHVIYMFYSEGNNNITHNIAHENIH
jgi:hypothetical protein